MTQESTGDAELSTVRADAEESSIPVPSLDDVGWLLVGCGVFGAIITLLRDRRGFVDLVVPLGLIGLGSGVLLQRRRTHMNAAEENIRAELDALDPIARAQILKALAKEELGRLPGVGSSD